MRRATQVFCNSIGNVELGGPRGQDGLIEHQNRYNVVLQAVPVHEDLSDEGSLAVNVFQFLGGNVLALRELENILNSVNDFHGSVRVDETDITRAKPSILKRFSCLIRPFVIAGEDARPPAQKFASRVWFVRAEVLHLGHVLQAELDAGLGSAYVSAERVFLCGDGGAGGGLCQAVALLERAAEANLEEVEYLLVNWGRSSRHIANFPTQKHLNLLKNQGIIAPMSIDMIDAQSVLL